MALAPKQIDVILSTISGWLDLLGSTRGSVIYRGTSGWTAQTPGTSGYPLISNGTGADPTYSQLAETALNLTDVTTGNVSASAHGFAPKFPNNTTTFLRGDGTYATPPGTTGGAYNRRTNGVTKGSSNTNVVIFGTAAEDTGTDITYTNSATNGDSFVVNTTGIYTITYSFYGVLPTDIITLDMSSVFAGNFEINVGAAIGNTLNTATTRAVSQQQQGTITWTGPITATNLIWILASTDLTSDQYRNQITIVRLI